MKYSQKITATFYNPLFKTSNLFISIALFLMLIFIPTATAEEFTQEHKAWLKNQFGEQHEQLIPIVAVADMYFACNKQRQINTGDTSLTDLITQVSRNALGQKLIDCLGEDDVKSDVALNFGLLGCFHQQLGHLPLEEKQQKMVIVKKTILALSKEERQQSFAKCVNSQAIHYLT